MKFGRRVRGDHGDVISFAGQRIVNLPLTVLHQVLLTPAHLPEQVLTEWVRIVAPGGRLEIWVLDGLKICKAFVDAEERRSRDYEQDGWYRFNDRTDPCRWASGRIFSYGDGVGTLGHPNWHLAVFSHRYLEQALRNAGCRTVERLQRSQVRGHDHGWINLGIAGIK